MLPFLKNKQEATTSGDPDHLEREHDSVNALAVCMEELFNAQTNEERAAAFRAAFQILEIEPHEEVEHV